MLMPIVITLKQLGPTQQIEQGQPNLTQAKLGRGCLSIKLASRILTKYIAALEMRARQVQAEVSDPANLKGTDAAAQTPTTSGFWFLRCWLAVCCFLLGVLSEDRQT